MINGLANAAKIFWMFHHTAATIKVYVMTDSL